MTGGWMRGAVLAIAIGAGTFLFGWWSVPVLCLAWGVLGGGRRYVGLTAGVAASLAWAGLLLIAAGRGAPIAHFSRQLSGAMQISPWGLWGAELLFPLITGWAAAALGAALFARRSRRDGLPARQ